MNTRRHVLAATLGSLLAFGSGSALAQDDKAPIRLLVGLAAGGTVDIAARLVAEKLSASLGRTVIVDNKPGAGQRLALGELRRAAPDGRTLMLTTDGPFVINPHIFRKLDYAATDFTPIAGVADFDLGLGVGPKVDIKDMKQFLAWARTNKTVIYGSPGNGTLPHFSGVALGQAAGVEMTHVPYKGGTPAAQDLVGGQIPSLITSLNDMIELHRAGRIRIIAVSGEKRSQVLPEVPTMIESGVNVSGTVKIGVYAPAGLPPALARQYEQAILAAVRAPDVREKMLQNSMNPAPLAGEALAAAARAEVKRLEPIVKASGYQPE